MMIIDHMSNVKDMVFFSVKHNTRNDVHRCYVKYSVRGIFVSKIQIKNDDHRCMLNIKGTVFVVEDTDTKNDGH